MKNFINRWPLRKIIKSGLVQLGEQQCKVAALVIGTVTIIYSEGIPYSFASDDGAVNAKSLLGIKSFVLYDSNADIRSSCQPYLDSPLYALSFPVESAQNFELRVTTYSLDGTNYWISGRMSTSGQVISPLHVDCNPILKSPHDADSNREKGSQWLIGVYKHQNGNLYSIIHNEFYGGYFPPQTDFMIPASAGCSLGATQSRPVNPFGCTYVTLVAAVMPKGASAFRILGSPESSLVARPSFSYKADVGHQTGYFVNTNVVKNSDQYYYAIAVDILLDSSERRCPIRNSDISDPSSWRGWGGKEFNTQISRGADCAGVELPMFPFYLGYSIFFHQFISVGAIADSGSTSQIGYSLSKDMIHWSRPTGLNVPIFDRQTDDWSHNNYPSLIDPSYLQHGKDYNAVSGGVVGQAPFLVFIQHRGSSATRAVAMPITFAH